MRTLNKIVLVATLLAPLCLLRGQTITDNFSSGADWGTSGGNGTTAAIGISGGYGNYTVSGPTENDVAFLKYNGAVGSYTSNWSVQVQVLFATPSSMFTGGTQQAINAGLLVTKTGSSIGVVDDKPTFDGFMLNFNEYYNGSVTSRDVRTSVLWANVIPVDGETRYDPFSGVGIARTTTLKISYDSSTHVLSGYYDSAGGTSFSSMNTAGYDSVNVASGATWSMTASDTFSIYLWGQSMLDNGMGLGPLLDGGDVRFDNFGASGLTAVPEPSTYAAILGAAALGLVAWRRRQRVAA